MTIFHKFSDDNHTVTVWRHYARIGRILLSWKLITHTGWETLFLKADIC